MLSSLRRFLSPPLFESEEKNRVARFLNSFSWSAIALLLAFILIRIILQFENDSVSLLFIGLVILILGIVQLFMRLGYVRGASIFLVFSSWILMSYEAWSTDGIREALPVTYLVIILLSSFLLGWHAALATVVMSIAAIWFFAVLEQESILAIAVKDPLNHARDLTLIFLLAGALVYLLINNLNRSLYDSRLELKERLRAKEKLQRQTRYLTALHETTLGLINHLELRPLLESILTRACELAETEHGLLELVLPDGSALKQELGRGLFSQFDDNLTLKDTGVTGSVWSSGKYLKIQNYAKWEKSIPVYVTAGIRAIMGVPLISGERVIGVLAFAHIKEGQFFSVEQTSSMERFAALASLAIDNAHLYEQAQTELKERRSTEIALRASEERFLKIFHDSPVAICITSLDEGRLLDANPAYWNLTELDPKTSLGRTDLELDLWSDPQERSNFLDKLMRARSINEPDYQFKSFKGEDKAAIAFYELIHLEGQLCVLAMFYDVTAQKMAQEALLQSEARTSALLNAIPDMIFEFSYDGVFLNFVPAKDIQPAISPKQFLGKNLKDLFPPEIAAQTLFALERAMETGQLHAFEYGLPPGEELHFFEARIAAVSSESALMMVRDISQRKWVETEREKLIKELEDKNAELERFTYTVSHDLKSPLITIKGFLGFLEKDAASGNTTRLKSDIKRIADATDKMHLLLSELLELSRVGRLMNPSQQIPFEDLVHEAVELVQGRLQERGIKVQIQSGLPIVNGDRQRLVEVIQNLVDNAAKFMGDQAAPCIEIGASAGQNENSIFFVRDNGIGIAPEYQERIFGLFNKLDANTDGTGIGLALVRRIIEVHGGRIWVESEAGKGAMFCFTLGNSPG